MISELYSFCGEEADVRTEEVSNLKYVAHRRSTLY